MTDQGLAIFNIDSYVNKTWLLRDQLTAFTANFIPNLIPLAQLIEPVIIPQAHTEANLKTGLIIEGSDITSALLNQSLEYFQKALYNFKVHYLLAQNGYKTWSSVTNYYSSYFSLFSLLSLQGRAITRIKLDGVAEKMCLIHPLDFRNHRYILTNKESGDSTHRLPWKKYYEIYDSYGLLKPEFDVVQLKRFNALPIDETEARNKINYKIFEGFQEVIDLSSLQAFQGQYLSAILNPALGNPVNDYIISLNSLASDPDLKYFARSALRLILIRTIFEEIGNINQNFKDEIIKRIPIWQSTLFDMYAPPINYFEDFIPTFVQ
jgi:hypothetical protein